jgi:hypothetical protein
VNLKPVHCVSYTCTGTLKQCFVSRSGSAFDGRLDPDPGGLKRAKIKGKTQQRIQHYLFGSGSLIPPFFETLTWIQILIDYQYQKVLDPVSDPTKNIHSFTISTIIKAISWHFTAYFTKKMFD